ncbi:MAG: hypothetical protein L3J34_03895 [Flavobacteriaceae bacterium]|nr:hypothetical protein [Flavobacteriaceae bacterium]
MKNLDFYSVEEINSEIAFQINGGSFGRKLGAALHSMWDSFVSSFENTGAGTSNSLYGAQPFY